MDDEEIRRLAISIGNDMFLNDHDVIGMIEEALAVPTDGLRTDFMDFQTQRDVDIRQAQQSLFHDNPQVRDIGQEALLDAAESHREMLIAREGIELQGESLNPQTTDRER